MSVVEIIIYLVFFIGLIIVLIGIYFYNKRHKATIKIVKKKNYHNKQKNTKVSYVKNEKFNWDLYENSITGDENIFLGFDAWENEEVAAYRIDELKKEFKDNNFVMLHMIEMLLIIDEYGENINLNKNGEFIINLTYLSNFILSLDYDINMIKKLNELKKEYLDTTSEIEIDAKEIFFIMRNAKNFGLSNTNTEKQLFKFINNKINNNYFSNNVNPNDDNLIKIIVDDNLISQNNNILETENEITPIKDVLVEIKKDIITESLENGYTKITYPNGTSIIKNGPWEIIEIITPDKKDDTKNITDTKKIIEIINNDNVNNKDQIITQEINKISENEIKKEITVEKEIIKKETEYIMNMNINNSNNVFLKINNKEISFYKSFGEINNIEEFKNKMELLSDEDLFLLVSIIIEESFYKYEINYIDKELVNFNCLLTDGKKYYIVYDYLIFILLSLAKNRNKFLVDNILLNIETFAIRFPVKIVDIFLNLYNTRFNDKLFVEENTKNYFYKSFLVNEKYYKANLMILSDDIINHINSTDNKIFDKIDNIKIFNAEENRIFKKNKKVFHSINFKIFKNDGDENAR